MATYALAVASELNLDEVDRTTIRIGSTSYRLFGQLHAQVDQVDVASKVEELETTYLAVVRDFG